MHYLLDEQDFNDAFSQSDLERCQHFVSAAAQHKEVWGLKNNVGWATVESDGSVCVPVWPHPQFAASLAKDNWEYYEAVLIPLHEFLSTMLPGMDKDNVLLALFPNLELEGVVTTAAQAKSIIEEALEH